VTPVRAGEELDVDAVTRWLKTIVPELDGRPDVTQYQGGASNWTYRLQYRDHDWVLRRPPAGTKAKSAHDMTREFKIQSALKSEYPVVPTMIGLCQDASVIGCDFYVMERINGTILRREVPRDMNLNKDDTRKLCTNMLDKLIELHRVDPARVGLDALGKGPGYPTRQVTGWSERYEKARTWNVPSYRYVRDWLREHAPTDSGSCVIHNDWRFDNLVLAPEDPTRIVGVLDWELATIGDPLMDLGSALAYWVEADDQPLMRMTRRQPTHLPGMRSAARSSRTTSTARD
jgi:aminoglycoside phosphotransferase (APT) family kinase protein